ncbi:MAG: hypothetical protein UR93_C0029G0015, partial [Berkelbacteria bacterium GW2011_GWA2_35_9]
MIDIELIKRKLTQISNKLNELEEVAQTPKEKFAESLIHYEAERLVELIVGNAIDINFHIIKEKQLNAPIEYKESFKVIGRDKVISSELAYRIA